MDFFLGLDPALASNAQLLRFLHNGDHHKLDDPSPSQIYFRDRNAMASTAVDVKEFPDSYVFVADMPGLKSSDVKVTVESGNVLVLSGERKKEEETNAEVRYLSMERRALRFMRKFTLPGNADTNHISAACQDGVLTVTVPKIPPPTPKVISINVA